MSSSQNVKGGMKTRKKAMMQYRNPIELRETFTNVHQFHINSLSQSSDCESILSSDDTTVNLWNLEKSLQPNQ